ncbi:MAG: Asp-tRNA(Asn)/Glu-tRNA(Gln) amidotransferase subunit GatB [Lentisphaerae bacterium]|nr:Asp-tRNA(Asn)/Glu-tRNA(Gln) amidotransferase subunit GatB [Lentisphaerota bacterium]
MKYLTTIGLEVHVQLRTRSKMFCACGTGFGAPPNTQVCPVCLGYPGAMPVMNEEAIRLTVMTGLALGCAIPAFSKFDRKSYFYPDMPKNYQISQYDCPLCDGGAVEFESGGQGRRVRMVRIHLEEDVAKNMHFPSFSGVDFNRAGVPLMEIVTQPDMGSPEEAMDFLLALKQTLSYLGVSDCNLEEGNVRCDVNCSVRPDGQEELGTKTEIKNLNTFKGVFHALRHELDRQVDVLESGGRVTQETRRWDADQGVTYSMRSKEDAHDYRYFPEPDLMPVELDAATVGEWRAAIPELPGARRARLTAEYGIPGYAAGVIAADRAVADYFEAAARASKNAKAVSNWVMTEMLRLLGERGMTIGNARVTPGALARLVSLVDSGVVSSTAAKDVFAAMFESGGDPDALVREKGLAQVSDASEIEAIVDRAMEENPKSVADFMQGKSAAAKFLVGQVMRLSRGKANPKLVNEILERKLGAE